MLQPWQQNLTDYGGENLRQRNQLISHESHEKIVAQTKIVAVGVESRGAALKCSS